MILITGLTGTSGSVFYKVLCREHYKEKIRVVVRKTTNRSIFLNSPLNIELVEGSIGDHEFLIKALDGCDKVFHIAAKDGATPIVEAIAKSPQVKQVIMVSSTIVFSNYYRTSYLKRDEKGYIEIFDHMGIKYVFIRPTMIFGSPGDRNISVFIRWLLKYPVFPIVKRGSATIQPVSRDDLAEAYWLILKNIDMLKQNEYIVSGRDKMTLLEMFQIITALSGSRTKFVNVPFPFAKFFVQVAYYVSRKKIDFREKLDRLTEDRAYRHDAISEEMGYSPLSFTERVKPLIDEVKKEM